MRKDGKWSKEELDELGPTLRSHIESEPKQKLKRIFDRATMKYKVIVDDSEKQYCHKCCLVFIAKNPKRRFCSDICRVEYHKDLIAKRRMIEKRIQMRRINQMWGM